MNRWLAALIVMAACKSPPKHSASAPNRAQTSAAVARVAGPDDAAFVIARPVVTHDPLPPQFAAALPAGAADLQRVLPPGSYVARALATNTAGMRERLLAALQRVHAPISPEVASWYRDALGYRIAPETCSWFVATADKVQGDGRELLWKLVEKCRDPSFAATLDRNDVPASVVVGWYFAQFGTFPFRESVAKAAGEVARTSTDSDEVRKIGFVFARMEGDAAVAAMKALQATIDDPKRRALVALGMLHSKSPAGQAIGTESCKQAALADDPMCDGKHKHGSYGDSFEQKRRAARTVEAKLELGESREVLLAAFPKPRVLAALETCARTGTTYRRARCFEDIAAIDRPTALRLAPALADNDDKQVARMARTLLKFPEQGALEKELERLGFVLEPPQSAPDSDKQKPDEPLPLRDAQDVLVARGKADMFDVETDQFPNEHDKLLGRLAELAKPTLDDVVFQEIPPPEDSDDKPYSLYAYTSGVRYSLVAENHGDWYDVDAVVGLLNELLLAKGSDTRMVVLPTGGQEAIVLAAPKAALLAASKAGLLDFGSTSEAEKAGKDFEDRVFNELSKDGNPVQRDVRLAPK